MGRELSRAEPPVAADGAGITAFRGSTSREPAPLLNFIVRLDRERSNAAMQQLAINLPAAIDSIAISPDEQWLAINLAQAPSITLGTKKTIRYWNLQKLHQQPKAIEGKEPERMVFSPDGRFLYYRGSGGAARTLFRHPFPGPGRLMRVFGDEKVDSFAFVPNSSLLLAEETDAFGLDLASKKRFSVPLEGFDFTAKDPDHGLPMISLQPPLRVRPDGKLIAARLTEPWEKKRTVQAWTFPEGKHVGASTPTAIGDRANWVFDLQFSPDGRFLVGKRLHDLVVWDGGSMNELATLTPSGVRAESPPNYASVWCIAFTPDGRRLAAGCEGGKISFWDTATWKKKDIDCRCRGVYALAFSRGGQMFACVDFSLAVWESGEY